MEPIYLDQEDEKLLETIPSTELHIEDKSQIIKRLRLHQPVTSERNVWAFWDKGFDAVLPWCHRNVIDWVQRLNHSWTVRVLDITPGSPNNVYKFVGPEAFPVAFNQNIMNGQNKAQHASDFVRLALLERVSCFNAFPRNPFSTPSETQVGLVKKGSKQLRTRITSTSTAGSTWTSVRFSSAILRTSAGPLSKIQIPPSR